MKIDVFQAAWDRLQDSIKNTAAHYPEGRNILIRCLSRNAKRTEAETVRWLKENNIEIKDLDDYVINDGND